MLLALIALSGGWAGLRAQENKLVWPQFRGPMGNGYSPARNLPTEWGGFLQSPRWQISIPGRGWSSPIIVGSNVWLTSAEVESLPGSRAADKLNFDAEGPLYFQTHARVTFWVMAIDLSTGVVRHRLELFTANNPAPIHATNSYATPTPVSDGRFVYCHFGSLGTLAVDAESAQVRWHRQLKVEDITGPGSSPILWEQLLILTCDGADEQYLVGLDKHTGETVWKTNRPPMLVRDKQHRRAFSTPSLIEHSGKQQLIAPTAQWVVSYDPATGREHWRCRTTDGYSVVPQVACVDGIVVASTGYLKPELWAISIDGDGDVSSTHVLWKSARQAPELASPIIIAKAVYTLSSQGVLSVRDLRSGAIRWQQRLEGSFAASPVFADGKLYITSRSGVTTVIQPGDRFHELARNDTFGETLATMAVGDDCLILRTDPVLYCLAKTE
jgi:outer membrane protein assembly factor BamB